MTTWTGTYSLNRFPVRQKDLLRAWDASDEYVLEHLKEHELFSGEGHSLTPKLLILNDNFGALSVALHQWQPFSMSDSWLAHQGILSNYRQNQLPTESLTLWPSLEVPKPPGSSAWDVVVIKIPKNRSMLEYQLKQIRPFLHESTVVVAAVMVKYFHKSLLDVFEKVIGPTKTSLARKKARLVFCELSVDRQHQKLPAYEPHQYVLEGTDYQILNHANVFSRESLDIGTRFFLKYLPSTQDVVDVVDLGCGNGVVGLMVKHLNPLARLSFVDESFMAVSSAQENYCRAFDESNLSENDNEHSVTFQVMDCLSGMESDSKDWIFNNPPFHQQNSVSDIVAKQMFKDAKRVLKPGGEFWVVGNRHLGYHVLLKRLFGRCETVASNKKFVILKATKS